MTAQSWSKTWTQKHRSVLDAWRQKTRGLTVRNAGFWIFCDFLLPHPGERGSLIMP
jgi:hypothetical protein